MNWGREGRGVKETRWDQKAKRRSIEEKEKILYEAEKEAANNIDAANKLLSDETTKLANSISSSAVHQQGVKVASLMIKTAKPNLEKAKLSFCEW